MLSAYHYQEALCYKYSIIYLQKQINVKNHYRRFLFLKEVVASVRILILRMKVSVNVSLNFSDRLIS